MKNSVMNLARVCAAVAMLLGGAAVTEAAPFTLNNGASSVNLCFEGCGGPGFGLSDWISDGTPVTGFQQWFFGTVDDSGPPINWAGTLDSLVLGTHSNAGANANALYKDAGGNFGFELNYELGVSHILETIIFHNYTSTGYFFLSLTDGMNVNVDNYYSDQDHWKNFTIANVDYTPNPEPMSLLLMGTGLAAVARNRWRKTATA